MKDGSSVGVAILGVPAKATIKEVDIDYCYFIWYLLKLEFYQLYWTLLIWSSNEFPLFLCFAGYNPWWSSTCRKDIEYCLCSGSVVISILFHLRFDSPHVLTPKSEFASNFVHRPCNLVLLIFVIYVHFGYFVLDMMVLYILTWPFWFRMFWCKVEYLWYFLFVDGYVFCMTIGLVFGCILVFG